MRTASSSDMITRLARRLLLCNEASSSRALKWSFTAILSSDAVSFIRQCFVVLPVYCASYCCRHSRNERVISTGLCHRLHMAAYMCVMNGLYATSFCVCIRQYDVCLYSNFNTFNKITECLISCFVQQIQALVKRQIFTYTSTCI